MKRPKHLDPPRYLSKSPPVPAPDSPAPSTPEAAEQPAGEEQRPDPTRYGDWERKGIAVDF